MTNYTFNPQSRIKDIFIELPEYKFSHQAGQTNDRYVGRKAVQDRLKMLLSKSDCPSGAYLITGYRGMGKTSLIEKVITDLNSQNSSKVKLYEKLDISLSQDDVEDMDVLRLMARQLFNIWEKVCKRKFDTDINDSFSYILRRLNSLLDCMNYAIMRDLTDKTTERISYSEPQSDENKAETARSLILSRSAFKPKEIEKELITILNEIDELREKMKANKIIIPIFIFVVDELDKIEPNFLFDKDLKETVETKHAKKPKSRTLLVNHLLANLKHFLNTAKAKFIFIGGREMYDAGLADIADRESFYSSIFHDIIYVRSFFKDKITTRSGITQLTEGYLCKLILPTIPNADSDDVYNLKTVFEYFMSSIPEDIKADEKAFEERRKEIYKVIMLLQNFVLFLTYRSNGTPKKLVSLIEFYMVWETDSYVSELKKSNTAFHKGYLTDKPDEKRLYLKFTYNKQYEIGLTSNLYRPYAIVNSRSLKPLGDKLLYSTAFLIDYILKFHQNAFSWRNLELIPEIILVNKDPNLRQYLEDLLNTLSGMYIRETVNSIFQYKFFTKATHEIRLLSKILEPASAAFNFTLDESEHIKGYYRRQLLDLQSTNTNHHKEFIYSVAFIQSILGDLHFFDGEYDKAISYHTDALQVLRQKIQSKKGDVTKHQVVFYVKQKLLLGLCFEKIRSYDSAYAVYRSLILNVPVILDRVTFKSKIKSSTDEWDKPIRRLQLFIRPHIALLDLIEKQRMDGITYANLLRNFREVHDFLIEKKERKKNLNIGFKMPKKLKQQDGVRNHTLLADYYSNVGSMLFFKNRNFPELYKILKKEDAGKPYTSFEQMSDFIQTHKDMTIQKNEKEVSYYNPSLSAYTYYRLALKELLAIHAKDLKKLQKRYAKNKSQEIIENPFIQAALLLTASEDGLLNTMVLFNFGNLLTKISDVLMSSMPLNETKKPISAEILNLFGGESLNEIRYASNVDTKVVDKLITKINDYVKSDKDYFTHDFVLLINRLAGLFYRRSGRFYSYAFQYKKFLYILKDSICLFIDKQDFGKQGDPKAAVDAELVKDVAEKTALRIFQINTWIQNVANRLQILKYREIFDGGILLENEETKAIYLNLTTSPEIRETIAVVEELKLGLIRQANSKTKPDFINIVSPNDSISSRFARVIELRFQTDINMYRLECLFVADDLERWKKPYEELNESEIKSIRDKIIDNQKVIHDCICDSIFALFEVTKTLHLYGESYVVSHSYLASNHRKLAGWCQMYENYQILIEPNKVSIATAKPEVEQIHKTMEKLLGKHDMIFIEPFYQYEQAINHLYSAIQTHNGGRAYRSLNKNMSFSEDDFNDNLTNFSAASERFRINSGIIHGQINKLKEKLALSKVYIYKRYRNG